MHTIVPKYIQVRTSAESIKRIVFFHFLCRPAKENFPQGKKLYYVYVIVYTIYTSIWSVVAKNEPAQNLFGKKKLLLLCGGRFYAAAAYVIRKEYLHKFIIRFVRCVFSIRK